MSDEGYNEVSSTEGGPIAWSDPLLSEVHWKKIAPLLPPKHQKGGHLWIENRRVPEGILRILRSGARWQDLPEKHPHPSTCWRRVRDWEEQGVWQNIWHTFQNECQQLKFHSREKGTQESQKPSRAEGRSGWWWSTARVLFGETSFTLRLQRKSGWLGRCWRRIQYWQFVRPGHEASSSNRVLPVSLP